jgi:hypothetical protein
MKLNGKLRVALVLALLLAFISAAQLPETSSAVRYWWDVGHARPSDFIVPHWWTSYTLISALFAPSWLACICTAVFLCRRWPLFCVMTLGAFLILEPMSCASAPSADPDSQSPLGLEELPFATAERAADERHLERMDRLLKLSGDDAGEFPTTEKELRDAIGDLAFETSPYEQAGRKLPFDLRLVINQGTPHSETPEKPGIVYYAVDASGRQFVLTISGLNEPISGRGSMMKASTFVGRKQPWGGLLASEESLYQKFFPQTH